MEVWREEALVRDIFDRHLISFASSYSAQKLIGADTAAEGMRRAARTIYQTEKYGKRGEFGELLLHAILRDVFSSDPVISKIYFKDSPNDTVKGFDAVHIVQVDNNVELWLGEVKYYKNVRQAISDVVAELHAHLEADYLRGEFTAIGSKIDTDWPHAAYVNKLIDQNTSLDQIFQTVTIPVLLTYESAAVLGNTAVCDQYISEVKAEAEAAWDLFTEKIATNWRVRLRLILLPLRDKDDLTNLMHERLGLWQAI